MTIKNFDTPLLDLNDKPIKSSDNGGADATMKDVIVSCLNLTFADEQNMTGEKKFKRFLLTQKVHAGGEVDVKPEEIVEMKLVVGKSQGPIIVGRVYQFLDA